MSAFIFAPFFEWALPFGVYCAKLTKLKTSRSLQPFIYTYVGFWHIDCRGYRLILWPIKCFNELMISSGLKRLKIDELFLTHLS